MDAISAVELVIERVRGVSQLKDISQLRRFELSTLKLLEGVLVLVRELNSDKMEAQRKLKALLKQTSVLFKENAEVMSRYEEARMVMKQMEGDSLRTRNDMLRFHGEYTHKQIECEQLKAQLSWMSTDLKEKQQELWSLVCLGAEDAGVFNATTDNMSVKSGNTRRSPTRATTKGKGGSNGQQHTNNSSTTGAANAPARTMMMPGVLNRSGSNSDNLVILSEVKRHKYAQGAPHPKLSQEIFFRPKRRVSIEVLRTRDVDTFELTDADMMQLIELMFDDLNLFVTANLSRQKFRNFLLVAHSHYRGNPFHNFQHAFCVCQMSFHFLSLGLKSRLLPWEMVALLASAIGHDLDHPGLNNGFQVSSKSPLAIIYNDESVLEMYHSACLSELLIHPETNFLCDMGADQAKVRAAAMKMVLSTDMNRHFIILSDAEQRSSLDMENPADREMLLVLLLKGADVSNEVRPFLVCRRWANNLLDEFFGQSDLEKKLDVPMTAFMRRDAVVLTKMQVGFIDGLLIPLFQVISRLAPELSVCLEHLKANRDRWDEIEKQNAEAAAAAPPPAAIPAAMSQIESYKLLQNTPPTLSPRPGGAGAHGHHHNVQQQQQNSQSSPRSTTSNAGGGGGTGGTGAGSTGAAGAVPPLAKVMEIGASSGVASPRNAQGFASLSISTPRKTVPPPQPPSQQPQSAVSPRTTNNTSSSNAGGGAKGPISPRTNAPPAAAKPAPQAPAKTAGSTAAGAAGAASASSPRTGGAKAAAPAPAAEPAVDSALAPAIVKIQPVDVTDTVPDAATGNEPLPAAPTPGKPPRSHGKHAQANSGDDSSSAGGDTTAAAAAAVAAEGGSTKPASASPRHRKAKGSVEDESGAHQQQQEAGGGGGGGSADNASVASSPSRRQKTPGAKSARPSSVRDENDNTNNNNNDEESVASSRSRNKHAQEAAQQQQQQQQAEEEQQQQQQQERTSASPSRRRGSSSRRKNRDNNNEEGGGGEEEDAAAPRASSRSRGASGGGGGSSSRRKPKGEE